MIRRSAPGGACVDVAPHARERRTQGLFIALQHATKATTRFIDGLGSLRGKKAIVFCTYKLATGSMLPRMAAALEANGADVVGQFRFRGPEITEEFRALAAILGAGSAADR